jgi:hypothetical protein
MIIKESFRAVELLWAINIQPVRRLFIHHCPAARIVAIADFFVLKWSMDGAFIVSQ